MFSGSILFLEPRIGSDGLCCTYKPIIEYPFPSHFFRQETDVYVCRTCLPPVNWFVPISVYVAWASLLSCGYFPWGEIQYDPFVSSVLQSSTPYCVFAVGLFWRM